MSDIVADAKAWLAGIGGGSRLQTHSGNCHQWHSTCLVGKLIREIERLRTLAEQATPREGSVQGEGTLTDEERAALHWFAHYGLPEHRAATLRSLLERLHA
jgi:hypothetical protein